MYKNQLQELAQRSCFNLPSYACVREGPDHAPRFKASVNFHGEIFQGPSNCTTVRQAEHAAAEVALNNLSSRGPSRSLTARVLDETGVYKNLLQETAHRAGLKLPVYTTVRTGPGHQPIFTCTVELASMSFTGESAKTKKQAEKNAALAAWSSLKQMPEFGFCSQQSNESDCNEEQEQVVVTRVLAKFSSIEENRPVTQRQQPQLHHNHHQQHLHQRRKVMWGSRECFTSQNYEGNYQQKRMSLASSSSNFSSKNPVQQPRCSIAPIGARRLPPMPLYHQSASLTREPILSKDNTSANTPSFPSSFNKPMPVSAKKVSQTDLQDILLYLEKQQQKDESQQIPRNQLIIDKMKDQESYNNSANRTHIPLYARSLPSSTNTSKLTQAESRPFSLSPVVKSEVSATPSWNSQTMNIPNMFAARGFQASGIAPAVNMRTAIPVCAAPITSPPGNITVTKKEEGEISVASSKLDKLQL